MANDDPTDAAVMPPLENGERLIAAHAPLCPIVWDPNGRDEALDRVPRRAF